ncbi:MAG: glycoside hydrolase family 13 protein [Flavobacterium sp.]|nr:glycoside hydrolase family 13 protein [Flavobacterium sp.]
MRKFLAFLLLITATVSAQIERVEPPFWYSGMKNPELQILFYGKHIGKYDVSASDGTLIKNVVKTENPNYVFVTIDTENIEPSTITFSFKSGKKTAFTQKYELRARRQHSAFRESFTSADLIYLIMPDRFANGNPNNDNTPDTTEKVNRAHQDGRHGGDIQGIINNLDYIKELGATAIWNTPLNEDNDPRGSYHGYGQSDVYKIDPRYGTNDDYLKLSSELHKRDMKLIMDYVTNHWGKHWTFDDMPTYDWLHQFPGYAQTNYRMTTQFDTNASDIDTKMCVDGWFVKSMPDLNQSNPLMLNYLIQNAIWWIEYADLDGFRVDTYSYNDKHAISKWTKAITDEYPNFNIAGEVWMHDQAQMAYWQKDSKIGAIQSYNSYLPTVMDFTLHNAIGVMFNETESTWNKGMIHAYENFANDFLYPDINNIMVFAENHDTARINEIYPDFNKYKLAMSLIATVRGIPQIYYGSEIGMKGSKEKGDGDIRRDFPGGWPNDQNNAFTHQGRTAEQQQYFEFSSKLFNWRKTNSAIHNGKTTQYVPQDNVYVYFRYNSEKTVMVIINNSTKNQTLNTDRFAQNIKNFKSGTDVISGKTVNLSDLTIEASSAMIVELK